MCIWYIYIMNTIQLLKMSSCVIQSKMKDLMELSWMPDKEKRKVLDKLSYKYSIIIYNWLIVIRELAEKARVHV